MKIYQYILLLTLLLASSCAGDEPVVVVPDEAGETCNMVVYLTIPSLQEQGAESRTWGDPYPSTPGLPAESEVQTNYLYFVGHDGRIYQMTPTASERRGDLYAYTLKVNLNDNYVQQEGTSTYFISGKIVSLVNYPSEMPANPFTLSAANLDIIHEKGIIPMWGVSTIERLKLVKNETVEVPNPVKLLRAVPKLTFRLDDNFKNLYEIRSVDTPFDDFEQTAYYQPKYSNEYDFTTSISIEGCFNPAPTEKEKGGISHYYLNATRDEVYIYTGERKCGLRDDKPLYFTVTLARRDGTGVPFTGRVYLCDYYKTPGSPDYGRPDFSRPLTQLVRNHDYQYVISLSELKFVISFREWIFGGKVHIELEK